MRFDEKNFLGLALLLLLLAMRVSGRPAETFPDLMNKAGEAERAGRAEEAAALYRAALRLQPHSGPAEYGLGVAASLQNHYQEAIQLFTQALLDDPSLVDAYLFLGIAYFNMQSPAQALPSFEHFYRLRPRDPDIRFYLGGTYNALGNYSKAGEYYMAQVEVTPARLELWYYLGECLLNIPRQIKVNLSNSGDEGRYFLEMLDAQERAEEGDTPDSEIGYRQAIKAALRRPEGHVNLGNLLLGEGKPVEAAAQFQEALESASQNCRALEGLGDVELARGDILASIAQYEKVAGAREACIEEPVPTRLGLSHDDFDARLKALSEYAATAKWKSTATFELARVKGYGSGSNGGELPTGAAVSQPCPSLIPRQEWLSSPEVDLFRANRLASRGDLRCALQALSASKSRFHSGVEPDYWMFRLYMGIVKTVLIELASRAPDSYLISEVRAEALELQGNDTAAEKEYRNAIATSGKDPLPLMEFARFECKRDEPDDAVAVLKKVLELAPYNAQANDLMGEALFMKEDYAAAVPYLRNALRAEPGDEDRRIRLAQSLAKVDQEKEAVLTLEAAPNDPDGRIHYALAGYYRREGRKDDMQKALAYFQVHQSSQHTKSADPNETK